MIATIDDTIAGYDTDLRMLAARRAAVGAEVEACPGHQDVDVAQQDLLQAQANLSAVERTVTDRLGDLAQRERQVKDALLRLSGLAAENGLPTDQDALRGVDNALNGFADAAELWLDGYGALVAAHASARQLGDQAERSEALAGKVIADAAEARAEHRGKAAEVEEIERSAGLGYREVLARIDELRTRIKELDVGLRDARGDLVRLAGRLGELEIQRRADAVAREEAAVQRDEVSRRFRHLAAGTFPADGGLPDPVALHALLAESDGVRAARDAARQVAAAWPNIPHAAGNLGDAVLRLNEAVHECRTALSSRADLDLETDEDVQVFTAVVAGYGWVRPICCAPCRPKRSRHATRSQSRNAACSTVPSPATLAATWQLGSGKPTNSSTR